MTSDDSKERVVSGIVRSRTEGDRYDAEGRRAWQVEFDSDYFRSQYPILLDTNDQIAERLPSGKACALVVRAKNLKKNKEGVPHDGSMPWMYYWQIVRFAEEDEEPDTTPVTAGRPAQQKPQQANDHRPDPTRDSIERQTAAKEATAAREGPTLEDWDRAFFHIVARIQNRPAPTDGVQDDLEQDFSDADMMIPQEAN
jgi:hypothetical protein